MTHWDRQGTGRDELVKRLRDSFGQHQVVVAPSELLRHGTDESFHVPAAPDAVFLPESTEDVQRAMAIAFELGAPVVPWGTGTSLEGHVAALAGGLSVDMGKMNRVLQVNVEDMDCRVQAGCTRKQLNEELRHTGLWFSVDPGADASLGGMASTNASGTTSMRYGTMRTNVLGLTAVTPDGVVETGTRARKSSAGYDLTSLLVGSEGTLGCITEVQLRLHGKPEATAAIVASFDDPAGAVDTVVQALQMGLPLARAEFLDAISVGAVAERSTDVDLERGRPALFVELHGSPQAVEEQAEAFEPLARENGMVGTFRTAARQEDRARLWSARHQAVYAVLALRPGSRGCPTDVCVPISCLAECMADARAAVDEAGVIAPIFGHVGDGNFHVILLANPDTDTPEYLEKLESVNDAIVSSALRLGGTCTGEHGVGYGKRKWLEREHGPGAMAMMRAIKGAIDPRGLLNPGKAI